MSKVDRYVVYLDGIAKTVWASKAEAVASAVRIAGVGKAIVVKHPKRGLPFLVAA
ncbi:hypothetical protein ACQKKX_02325 [Neorhizobium sp. NPDC001467]|uniref:hypothetical protein n=1 Tax=Neorhizobium sp. NPDC001467 TaxID=3390595 RepID=UPI003D0892E3